MRVAAEALNCTTAARTPVSGTPPRPATRTVLVRPAKTGRWSTRRSWKRGCSAPAVRATPESVQPTTSTAMSTDRPAVLAMLMAPELSVGTQAKVVDERCAPKDAVGEVG